MITNLFLLFVIVASEADIVCPNHHWTAYKSIDEMSWSIVITNSPDKSSVNVVIKRNTTYKCSTEDHVMLCTNRKASFNASSVVNHLYEFRSIISIKCMQNCTNNSNIFVTTKIEFQNKTKKHTWSILNENTYVEKICDKFYWRSPNQIINIKASAPREKPVGICEDCDGEKVDKKYCIGNTTMLEDCQSSWGEWGKAGPCNITRCNPTVWERVRTRKCLYGNGSEAANVKLCSNQSEIMKEQCNISAESTTYCNLSNQSNYSGLYIVVGIGSLLILVCIFLLVLRYRHRKYRANSVTNQQSNSLELPVAEPSAISIKPNELGQGQPAKLNRYEDQKPSGSHEYELVKSSAFSSYEIVLPTESLENQRQQLDLPNEYEPAKPNVSNVVVAATQNVPDTDRSRTSGAHYFAEQTLGISTEQNNAYSTLANANSPTDRDYSALGPR